LNLRRLNIRPQRRIQTVMMMITGNILLATTCFALLTSSALRASDPVPLPPLDYVLDQILERAHLEERNDHDFKQLYAYRLVRVKDEFNSNGDLRKRDHRNRTHEPDPTVEPYLSLPSPNIKSPDEFEEQDEAAAAAAMQKGRAFEKSDFPLSRDLLDRFSFSIVGRDSSGPRPSLILDFQPADTRQPIRQFKDRFINRAAGRVWVDEGDWALARAELRLSEPVHVVGGLVGTVRRFHLSLVRDRTPEGLWHPSTVHWRLEGRQFLARKAIEYNEHMEDLRLAR
jgi:hypothetical protein